MRKKLTPAKKINLPLWLGASLVVLIVVGAGLAFLLNRPNTPAGSGQPTKSTGYQPNLGTPSLAAFSAAANSTTDPLKPTIPATAIAADSQATTPTGTVDERFGLIVTGLESEPNKTASLNRTLELSQARWWYQYGTDRPAGVNPQAQQIYLLRTWHEGVNSEDFKQWMNFIRQTGHFDKPTYWLISNEPNTDGQDDTPPEVYAEALYQANRTIRAADPHATIMGPNILNFDDTCQACPGFTAGHTWLDQARKVYQDRYGSDMPFDAWTIHTYSLDWDHLPLINQAQDNRQLEAYRTYLDSTPATRGKPIWLTEFGIVWGFDGLEWQKTESGAYTALPKGSLRQDLMEKYLSDKLDWLENNATRLKIDRWFVFTSYGVTESFSNFFGGISLFDSSTPTANLTAFGRIYTDRLKKVVTKK